MKLKINRQEIIFYGLQVAAWLVFLMVPAISAFITTHSWTDSLRAFDYNARIHWISALTQRRLHAICLTSTIGSMR